jgi:hypothetical protein
LQLIIALMFFLDAIAMARWGPPSKLSAVLLSAQWPSFLKDPVDATAL